MPKIVTIVGARPQFVKSAVVSRALSKHKNIEEVLVHTGQHYDSNMSDIFFEEMKIPNPKYSLNINNISHGAMTGRMLEQVEKVLNIEKPDYVLVFGDTNSTLAGALAAKKMHIRVAHVEAGLRSHNIKMPEEINRILTDRLSDILFCPTDKAFQNLKEEGFEKYDTAMFLSGDVMEDAVLQFLEIANKQSRIIDQLDLVGKPYLLCTVHRAENTDDPARLKKIIEGLNQLTETYELILPLHPRTQNLIKKNRFDLKIKMIPPVGYLDMLTLLKHCQLVLTDSGGLQKEAYFLGKFCITLRDETEWTELVEYGYNYLSGADVAKIVGISHLLMKRVFEKKHHFYGNGTASHKIASVLAEV